MGIEKIYARMRKLQESEVTAIGVLKEHEKITNLQTSILEYEKIF